MGWQAQASVLQVTYAVRNVRASHVFHDFASLGVADGIIRMPYSFWVVKTPEGPLLIDTGFHTPDAYWVDDATWRPVSEALVAVGIRPESVSRVILTHLHFDHAGHVDLFPNARIFVSRREYEHWAGESPEALLAGFVDPRHLAALDIARGEGRLELVDGESSPAPGVTMIAAPGHTPGQCAVLLDLPDGSMILASDAAHFFEQLERGWRFFAHTDARESDRTIGRLGRLAEQRGAPIIPGHDIRVSERYCPLPGAASSFVSILA